MGNAKIKPPNPDASLLPYQARWIADDSQLKLCEKSRQIGMSWTAAYAAVERAARQGARHDQWVASRDEGMAALFVEDCKFWAGTLALAADDMGEVVLDAAAPAGTARRLRMATGRSVYSLSSNADAQAGKRGHRILDEFALHPDPRKLYAIAMPGVTWGGQLEIISTHRGEGNYFNRLLAEIRDGGNPKRISHHRVTLEDALGQGFLHRLQAVLPPGDRRQAMDEQSYYDHVRAQCADEESFRQEYMCDPAGDESAFLSYDLIAACEYPPGERWQARGDGDLYAGVDIGRVSDLTVLWVVERDGSMLRTRHVATMQGQRKSAQEAVLDPWLRRCRRVCMDRTGLGIGWVDDAQDKFGRRVEGVTFTAPIKEALANRVRGAMDDRAVRIPCDREITADLRKVRKTVSAAGNVRFMAEADAAGHADRFWALALALEAASDAAGPFAGSLAGAPLPSAGLPGGRPGGRWRDELRGYLH